MNRNNSRPSGRREFLAQVGLAAMAGSGALGVSSGRLAAEELGPINAHQRAEKAYNLRHDAALFQRHLPLPSHAINGDDRRYHDFIGSFSKTLPHDFLGIVDDGAYAALRHALDTGSPGDFATIPMGGTAKLINPQTFPSAGTRPACTGAGTPLKA